MKGGVAVALELVRELAASEPGRVDVALLLFGREELPPEHNPLPALFDATPLVHEADLALLLEPTDLTIQAGCVGNLSARVTFHGVAGHSARPWLADNAVHRAIDGACRNRTARAPRGRRRRAPVLRGRFRDADRGRDGRQRRPRPGRRDAQPALSAGSLARGRRGLRSHPRPGRRDRRDRRQLPARRRRRRRAARPRAPRHRGLPARAQAGLDERRRLHVARHPGRQLRARSDPLRPRPRRAGRDRSRSSARTSPFASLSTSVSRVPLSPVLQAQETYPFVRLLAGCRGATRPGARGDRSRDGRSARADRSGDPPGAARRRPGAHGLSGGGGAPGASRGGRPLGGTALRRRPRSGLQRHPHARVEGGDLLVRPGRARRRRGSGHGRRDRARVPRSRTWRGIRRSARRRAPAAGGARLPPGARRGSRGGVGPHGPPLAQHAEQPDRGGRTARAAR